MSHHTIRQRPIPPSTLAHHSNGMPASSLRWSPGNPGEQPTYRGAQRWPAHVPCMLPTLTSITILRGTPSQDTDTAGHQLGLGLCVSVHRGDEGIRRLLALLECLGVQDPAVKAC